MDKTPPIYCSECRADVGEPCSLANCPVRPRETKPPENVVQLINWNSDDPKEIMRQVINWIDYHRAQGHKVHVVGCLIHTEPENEGNRYYQPFFTPTPAEIIHYACFRVQTRSWEKQQED